MRWLQGRRPKKPDGWDTDVSEAKKRVARWAKNGRKKSDDEESMFKDLWSAHKVAFSLVQHSKCGYCELHIAPDAHGGNIDHYRPKAKISRLLDDPDTWGREITGHNSRDPEAPRKTQHVCEGYFWLAYNWRNYLLSCSTCNQKWKGTLFPIKGGHAAAPTFQTAKNERPLLLNPYGKLDPSEHLQFDKLGLITPRDDSPLGLETIRTCGLTRDTLRRLRKPIAEEACRLIRRVAYGLEQNDLDARKFRIALGRLMRLGTPSAAHSGMVRILWAQQNGFGFTWSVLRELNEQLKPLRK